jgi:uncharacterized repeat protein (TIGR03803 family)
MKHLLTGLAILAVLCGCGDVLAQTTVTLASAASPDTGEPGVTSITLIGYGFPSGTIAAADVTVTLQPSKAGHGPSGTAQPTSVQPLFGSTVQFAFIIPTTIVVHQDVNYVVSIAGSTLTGAEFSSGNTAALQITPAAELTISPTAASPGQSLIETLSGENTNFFPGATQANFGPGISVGGAPPGEWGPVTVNGPTSATAQLVLSIPLNFTINPVSVATGTEQVYYQTGFQVTNFSWVYQFAGPPGNDGANPKRVPIIAAGPGGVSALFGVTPYGGTANFGTVYSYPLAFGKADSVLYSFAGPPNDGETPDGALVMAGNGVLYGTTGGGGSHSPSGTVYSLAPPATPGGAWTETVLHNFAGGPTDGANSYSALFIAGESGGLPVVYGTTFNGGTDSNGVVFSMIPPATQGGAWTESIIHFFTGSPHDGANPHTAVTPGAGGVYYGSTYNGGASNNGTVYELTPPASPGGKWTESVLCSFAGTPTDGANPHGDLLVGPGGVLYGTTLGGGPKNFGTVFSLTPPASPGGKWTEDLLYEFAGPPDASQPRAGLVMGTGSGGQLVLYSTTYLGGTTNVGTVFSLTAPSSPGGKWTETILYDLYSPGGYNPEAGLVMDGAGGLYGAAGYGGSSGYGNLYYVVP